MIAVIFEVVLNKGFKDNYLKIAQDLKQELEKMDGFISVERFKSIYTENKFLSLSFWECEEAIKNWRNLEQHREAQEKGRKYIFSDYRLRIATIERDYGMNERTEAPKDSSSIYR